LFAAGALYSVGAPIFARRIESDLERRVPNRLAEAGYGGVTAEFSGQDGTLHCRSALSDPVDAAAVAYAVRGVRAITLDRACRINRVAGDEAAASSIPGATATPATTTERPTTTTTVAAPTIAPDQPATVTATIAAGTVTLSGVVGSEVERARLRDAAALAVQPEHVVDQLTIDPARALGDEVSGELVQLIAVAAGNLTSGAAGFEGESLTVTGTYADDASAAAVEAVADELGITADLEPQPPSTTLEPPP
jgi:hypothetical protein